MPTISFTTTSTATTLLLLGLLLTSPSPARAFDPPPIPLNWTTQYPCAIDTPARVLTGVSTYLLPASNTPAACIALCDAADFTYAGVEYADECHCGTGLVSTGVESAPVAECDMGCTGDADLSCGGAWRIQVRILTLSPALPPGGWSLQGCFLDTPSTPAFPPGAPTTVHHTFPTNLDLVSQCIDFCQHAGMPWAGVEDAQDCQCSAVGYASGAVRVDESQCNSTCPLPPGEGNEYCGGFQRLMVYEYQG
ncbi:hypothetical protein L226DRAFT_477970 [Lentinus tigrinus ALCF2SS1-7]|uniref:uncharacterized protein n=1 Tax=Lentinus tigrinus ALCF2SS1-7 TaxID=1328758 RepID=UPI0011663819|nr:hypothetical protein L226DRAFT_477970 [Lentinus tigrinus ALCF2SS1-7]